MRLILIRHPAPQIAAGLCYGSSDVAIAPSVLRAALATLATTLPPPSQVNLPIYSSPLQRCATLSLALAAQRHAAPPRFDARLAEMDFGRWELQPWERIARAEIDAWVADLAHYAPGGGENVLQVATRVAAFVDALRGECTGDAIIVCHAGTMRLLTALHAAPPGTALASVAAQAAATPHRIDYAGTAVLQF